ncbi:MAG: hypothetical protein ACFE0J_20430 [Elainellaceae cyanobacterium]
MSRKKRSSIILKKAERRADGLLSIAQELDFGNENTLANFLAAIDEMRAKERTYNQMLSAIDSVYVEMLDYERCLADMCDHMLVNVASKFGRNSKEYEAAGGVRKSEQTRRQSLSRMKES